ncbi:MAG: SMC-Scp complex subunit ScpB [Planctomycetota bacterium]
MHILEADIVTEEAEGAPAPAPADLDTMTTDPRDEPGPDAGDASGEAEAGVSEETLPARVEALLVSTDRPLGDARLAELLGLRGRGSARKVARAITSLNEVYDQSGRAFRIERVAGGWQILTRAEHGPLLAKLHADRQSSRLSQPAMETLSIIAYRQPIMRAELEAIRGVASGEVLRGLLERRLVKIVGRAEELGRPMLYGTTREFLKVFGLASLDDLPAVEGAERRVKATTGAGPDGEEAPSADPPDPEVSAPDSGLSASAGDEAAPGEAPRTDD